MPRWKRVANNATLIVALVVAGLGYSIFVVVPAAMILLWLLRRGHLPNEVSPRAERLVRALDSRLVQAVASLVFVGIFLVERGPLYALASAALLVAVGLFAERFL
jgi:hypothetical protein